jgi:E3 ubiquitin-protein ligase MARCH6
MRIVTDPFVDFFTLVLRRFIFPFFYKTSRFFLTNVLGFITFFAGSLVPPSVVSSQSHDITSWVVRHTYISGYHGFTSSLQASKGSELSAVASLWLHSPPQERPPHLTQKINDFFEGNSTIAQLLEPRFAYVGREVRLVTNHFQQSWIRLTLGHGSSERAFAIVLGYGVVGIALALYLNVFTVGNARTAGRAVRNAVRQQLLVVKVCIFWSATGVRWC